MSETKILLNLSNHGWERIMSPALYEEISALGKVTRFNKNEPGASHEAMLAMAQESDIMVTSWQSEFLRPEDLGNTGSLKLAIHGAGSVRSVITSEIIACIL